MFFFLKKNTYNSSLRSCKRLKLDLPLITVEPGRAITARAALAIYTVGGTKVNSFDLIFLIFINFMLLLLLLLLFVVSMSKVFEHLFLLMVEWETILDLRCTMRNTAHCH
jgi:hypothetical protein